MSKQFFSFLVYSPLIPITRTTNQLGLWVTCSLFSILILCSMTCFTLLCGTTWHTVPIKYDKAVLLSRITCSGNTGRGWFGGRSFPSSSGFSCYYKHVTERSMWWCYAQSFINILPGCLLFCYIEENYLSLQYQVLPFTMKCMIQLLELPPACLPTYLTNQLIIPKQDVW